MTAKERKWLYQTGLTQEASLCANCQHYYQHYNERGVKVQCGHCVSPRIKTRMPYDTCGNFQWKEETER